MKKFLILNLFIIFIFSMASCVVDKDNIYSKTYEKENIYIITYELGEVSSDEFAFISSYTQKIKSEENYILYTPTCDGYNFIRWVDKVTNKEVVNGKYDFNKDITLVAQWQIDLTDNRWVYDPNGRI